MGLRGPLPQPRSVRYLRGNPGKRATYETPQAVRGIPEQPKWLSREAKAEWRRVTPELERLGLVTPLDRAILTMYCDVWSKWVAAGEALNDEGLLSKGYRAGLRKHPIYDIWRSAALMTDTLAKELGLTPNSRARMAISELMDDDESDLLD